MPYETDIYAKYAAGELPEEERLKLEQSGELAELDKILQTTNELKLPLYDFDKAYAKLNQQNNHVVKPSKIRRLILPLSIAASLLLMVGAFFLFNNSNTIIYADRSGKKTHVFQDGSIVSMNNGSSIEFDMGNWKNTRTIELQGEAFFKVEKGVPFIVETKYGTVKVLGTTFNVRTHENTLAVNCFSSMVQVSNLKGKQVILKAKQGVQLSLQEFEEVKPVEENKPMWQSGISSFNNTDAKFVFQELKRQYDLKIIGDFPDKNFTGRFVHNNLQEAVNQICKPLNLECQINKEKNQVEIK